MSSTVLSVLLVCNRRILKHRGKSSKMLSMFILTGPHVRHFSDGNQTVCPTLKNKSWPPIMPKQLEQFFDTPFRHPLFFKEIFGNDFLTIASGMRCSKIRKNETQSTRIR
jgi:hypothetical protein